MEKYAAYMKFHNYSKETFIKEILIFHEADITFGEKGLKRFKKAGCIKISPENLHLLTEVELIKIHMHFWKLI